MVLTAAVTAAALVLPPDGAVRAGERCERADRLRVPGAEHQIVACLDDVTTAGTTASGHTDPEDWAGLHAPGTRNPSGVPGIQVDGYFPDDSSFNGTHGWDHDSQFVIRLPDQWNGGVVVTGAPGVREQYANDFIIGDRVLDRGYAFASTDKGNVGTEFYRDGDRPGDAVAEWNERVTELTRATKAVARQLYGHMPRRTYVAGISNGGYLARWQLENRHHLYDGGVDWEGTLWRPDGPNLFTYLPTALREYPDYALTGDEEAHDAMIDAGFAPGSEFLWEYHYGVYWDLTQRIYREEFDPGYDGDTEAGTPFCRPGTPQCDADYDYHHRPESVHDAVEKVSLTGRIQRPMITLHGTLDALLPIRTDSDVYAEMVREAHRAKRFRYYRIEGGNHVDGLHAAYPERLRPMLPCFRSAFEALEGWVTDRRNPPDSATVPEPESGDEVNTCDLAG
ncbi:tannase/feruloyl esterase family alpha/beta hydrolase [Haloechinothrix aidingensis]|uniref:tannase/feruloyl esterase family alpha/beta hydrolase n=1 Tax=Haloechinothrix aidingensis TaxID=2752311 RepID=UPI003CCCB8D8